MLTCQLQTNGCLFIQHIFIEDLWCASNSVEIKMNCFLAIVAVASVLFGIVVKVVLTDHKTIHSFSKKYFARCSVCVPFPSPIWDPLCSSKGLVLSQALEPILTWNRNDFKRSDRSLGFEHFLLRQENMQQGDPASQQRRGSLGTYQQSQPSPVDPEERWDLLHGLVSVSQPNLAPHHQPSSPAGLAWQLQLWAAWASPTKAMLSCKILRALPPPLQHDLSMSELPHERKLLVSPSRLPIG